MRIDSPGAEQLGTIFTNISEALAALSPDSAAERQMRERSLFLIKKYSYYPKAVNVLSFGELADGTITDCFEWYVADEKMVMPDEKGMLPIPLLPQAVLNSDPDFGGENSWAAKRHAHIFSITK